MAKDKFYPTKPHVNVSRAESERGLRSLGISAVGARQILDGKQVTNQQDRTRLSQFVAQTAAR